MLSAPERVFEKVLRTLSRKNFAKYARKLQFALSFGGNFLL